MQRIWNLTAIFLMVVFFGSSIANGMAAPDSPLTLLPKSSLWQSIAGSFRMSSHYENPRVKRYIKFYSNNNAYHLNRFSKQASPYIYHVVKVLEEEQMPRELALLPMVESEYRPQATSNVGAAGLWQLSRDTGRLHGVKQDTWYDGRRDTDAATRAAVEHLRFLHEKFDNDWLLALAAYNAGGGRVSAAIKTNKRLGKPTDYWSLTLPKETQHFVPKFLALIYLIQNAADLEIELAPVPNQPYFTKVEVPTQIDAQQAAKFAGIELKEFKQLNQSLKTNKTHPKGPHTIILPVKNVQEFQRNYNQAQAAKVKAKATATKAKAKATTAAAKKPGSAKPALASKGGRIHTVSKGDTLHLIATRYSTTVKSLKTKNRLKSDIIRSGQKLAV